MTEKEEANKDICVFKNIVFVLNSVNIPFDYFEWNEHRTATLEWYGINGNKLNIEIGRASYSYYVIVNSTTSFYDGIDFEKLNIQSLIDQLTPR